MRGDLIRWIILAGLVAAGMPGYGVAQVNPHVDPGAIREGHWVEVRGKLDEAGVFQAARVEIVHEQRYEILIGTAEASERENHVRLLGRQVELNEKTTYRKLERDEVPGSRVKIEGYFRGVEKFSAREVAQRGQGRERIVGRADRVRREQDSIWLEVMGFTVLVPTMLDLDHEDPLEDYVLSQRRTQPVSRESRNEDDQFGKGIRISENVLFAGLAEARWTGEDEFDLDRRDPEDRQDSESSFRGRFIYRPSTSFVGVLEVSHRRLWRKDDEDGRIERDATVLGETFGYWFDPFGMATDVQAGRIDFDEEREWLYDQNLDGIRLFTTSSTGTAILALAWTEPIWAYAPMVNFLMIFTAGWISPICMAMTPAPPRRVGVSIWAPPGCLTAGSTLPRLMQWGRVMSLTAAATTLFARPVCRTTTPGLRGIGYRFKRKVSLDLVGHYYRQDELSNRWRESEIDSRPNGRSKDLGWEADLILGWRTHPSWDIEVVAAYFDPGKAFNDEDHALLGKVQLRFRF
jgi:hypothetical protein